MRLFVGFLLLAVVFLAGIVFGMKQESNVATEVPKATESTEATEVIEPEKNEVPVTETISIPTEQVAIEEASSSGKTQTIASVLEAGVKGFFEFIMQVMYQTAQLFF